MQQEAIFQFVCFITNKATEEFSEEWKSYRKKLGINKSTSILYRQADGKNDMFHYVAKFVCPEENFQFPFTNEPKSGRFSGSQIKALQTGGYSTIQHEYNCDQRNESTTVIAFVNQRDEDIAFYNHLPLYEQLNIHQAYYENCIYDYVMEFKVPVRHANQLVDCLQKRVGVITGIYRSNQLHKVQTLAILSN